MGPGPGATHAWAPGAVGSSTARWSLWSRCLRAGCRERSPAPRSPTSSPGLLCYSGVAGADRRPLLPEATAQWPRCPAPVLGRVPGRRAPKESVPRAIHWGPATPGPLADRDPARVSPARGRRLVGRLGVCGRKPLPGHQVLEIVLHKARLQGPHVSGTAPHSSPSAARPLPPRGLGRADGPSGRQVAKTQTSVLP